MMCRVTSWLTLSQSSFFHLPDSLGRGSWRCIRIVSNACIQSVSIIGKRVCHRKDEVPRIPAATWTGEDLESHLNEAQAKCDRNRSKFERIAKVDLLYSEMLESVVRTRK